MANVKHMAIFSAITGTRYSGYALDEVMGGSWPRVIQLVLLKRSIE